MSEIHPQARTTPRTRAEIKASSASLTELAERYNVVRIHAPLLDTPTQPVNPLKPA